MTSRQGLLERLKTAVVLAAVRDNLASVVDAEKAAHNKLGNSILDSMHFAF